MGRGGEAREEERGKEEERGRGRLGRSAKRRCGVRGGVWGQVRGGEGSEIVVKLLPAMTFLTLRSCH